MRLFSAAAPSWPDALLFAGATTPGRAICICLGNQACLVSRGLGRPQALPCGGPHANVQPLFGARALP
jgi:hypothetical protein